MRRYGLNKFLIGKAEEAGVKIHFGHCLETSETKFADSDDFCGGDVGSVLCFDVTAVDGTKSKRYVRCQCPVIGADGGGSRVRHAMRQQGLTEFTETLLGIET
jgi:2-polyprenyl-6-methoxyphenol hydroxylase-like FAD-dependent oxidoreductase